MTAFKLFRKKKDGTITSLFINKSEPIKFNKWLVSKAYLTKGFAFRPGWHCTLKKIAPHLSKTGRVWCEVEAEGFTKIERPARQGGTWLLAKKIKVVKEID